jgi:hypothetical protein
MEDVLALRANCRSFDCVEHDDAVLYFAQDDRVFWGLGEGKSNGNGKSKSNGKSKGRR